MATLYDIYLQRISSLAEAADKDAKASESENTNPEVVQNGVNYMHLQEESEDKASPKPTVVQQPIPTSVRGPGKFNYLS